MGRALFYFVYIALCVGAIWLAFQEITAGLNASSITDTTIIGSLVALVGGIPFLLLGAGIIAAIAQECPLWDNGAVLAISCVVSCGFCVVSWDTVVGLYNDQFGVAYQMRSSTNVVYAGTRMPKGASSFYPVYTTTVRFEDRPLCGKSLRFTDKHPGRYGASTKMAVSPTIAELTVSWLGTTLHTVRPATAADKPGQC